eukprot:gene11915-12007_t
MADWNCAEFYIDGKWVAPQAARYIDVIDPASELSIASLALGNAHDVNIAVAAAKRAFATFSLSSRDERLALLMRIAELMRARFDDLADAMTAEMGAPHVFAREGQVASGIEHIDRMIDVLRTYSFETHAIVFAEIMHEAGVPKGVFNLVHGDGPSVGHAMAIHPDIDVMSFTGSTRAGIQVARDSADTVKRVLQELGGNSANIVLDDADLETAVVNGVAGCYLNSGQSCDSPARLLVPHALMDKAIAFARAAALSYVVGKPKDTSTQLGPVVSEAHFRKIQGFIEIGIKEGAELVTGGVGRPEGFNAGYYVKPTVFGRVTPEMTIAKNEIFGPVLSIIGYASEAEAIKIANDTEYGLAAYVQSSDIKRAHTIARQMRAGTVQINYPAADYLVPFGGYKRSGNGREYGAYGLHDYLELKSIVGQELSRLTENMMVFFGNCGHLGLGQSMTVLFFNPFASQVCSSNKASAQSMDANMTCADYLKLDAQMGATPKTGDAAADAMAADLDSKMKAYCKANPTAKATEAAEKAMMGN